MDQAAQTNNDLPERGCGTIFAQERRHHNPVCNPTQHELHNDHNLHSSTFSAPHGQVAYPQDGSYSWSPYLLPVLDGVPGTTSDYGLYYTVAPTAMGFTDDGENYTAGGVTGIETALPAHYDPSPRSAGVIGLYEQDTVGQQQTAEDFAPQHGRHTPQHPSFYCYQEQVQTSLVLPTGWPSDQGHSDNTIVELQISRDPTPKTEQDHETPAPTDRRKRKPTATRTKRGKAEQKENDESQAPATKKRGRKPKAKALKPEIAPLAIWAPKAEETHQALFTASPDSFASQSSQAPANSMSYTAESTATSFDSNTAVHEAYVEAQQSDHTTFTSHSSDGYRRQSINTIFTPHTFTHPSSISSSPRPPPTPVTPTFPASSLATYPPHQQQQQQPPYHHHPQTQHRASFSGMPLSASHLLPSQLLPVGSRRQSTSSIDFTNFGDPLTLPKDQRARNRVAANKCRLKTKAAVTRLEEEERAASERHAELSRTVAGLKDEIYVLRNQLLMHTDCDCIMIQKYLANTARDLANAMGSSRSSTASSVHQNSSKSSPSSAAASRGDECAGEGSNEDVGKGETDDNDDEDDDMVEPYAKTPPGGATRSSRRRSPVGVALATFSSPATKVAAMEQIGKRAEKQRLQYLSRAMAMAGMVPLENQICSA